MLMDMKEFFMREAVREAEKALAADEVPVGAVIVRNGRIITRGHNQREFKQLATAHAEVIAIEKACKKRKSWRLADCELYVTLEPCYMCMGAALNARIKKVVFGARDPKSGCCGSIAELTTSLNHTCEIESGIFESECAKLLTDYFKAKRISDKEEAQKK